MTIIVELKLSSPYDLTAEEIEKDLRMAEDQIGWNYYYTIMDIKTTERLESRNPCCDCEESGMSMTCRCDDRKKYEYELEKFKHDNRIPT